MTKDNILSHSFLASIFNPNKQIPQNKPKKIWVACLASLTCTSVSAFHFPSGCEAAGNVEMINGSDNLRWLLDWQVLEVLFQKFQNGIFTIHADTLFCHEGGWPLFLPFGSLVNKDKVLQYDAKKLDKLYLQVFLGNLEFHLCNFPPAESLYYLYLSFVEVKVSR